MWSQAYRLSLLIAGLVIFALGNLALEIKSEPGGIGPLSLFRPHISQWLTAQYLVSYEVLGFTKRALVGTAVGLFFERPERFVLAWIAAVPALALVVVFALRLGDRVHPALAVVALVSPATFMQIGFDLGRFDQLIYLLVIAIVALTLAPLILFAPLALLIHEGALFVQLPFLATIHLARHGADRFFWLFVSTSVLIALLLFAQPVRVSLDELHAIYPSAAEPALAVYTRSFGANFAYLIWYIQMRTAGDAVAFALAALYLASTFAFVRPLVAETRAGRLCLLACLSPLMLSLIGFDWPRWVALSAFNVFLLATTELARFELPAGRYRAFLLLPLIGIPALGPLGTDQPFPFWR